MKKIITILIITLGFIFSGYVLYKTAQMDMQYHSDK